MLQTYWDNCTIWFSAYTIRRSSSSRRRRTRNDEITWCQSGSQSTVLSSRVKEDHLENKGRRKQTSSFSHFTCQQIRILCVCMCRITQLFIMCPDLLHTSGYYVLILLLTNNSRQHPDYLHQQTTPWTGYEHIPLHCAHNSNIRYVLAMTMDGMFTYTEQN